MSENLVATATLLVTILISYSVGYSVGYINGVFAKRGKHDGDELSDSPAGNVGTKRSPNSSPPPPPRRPGQ